jgi:hypothetical protein
VHPVAEHGGAEIALGGGARFREAPQQAGQVRGECGSPDVRRVEGVQRLVDLAGQREPTPGREQVVGALGVDRPPLASAPVREDRPRPRHQRAETREPLWLLAAAGRPLVRRPLAARTDVVRVEEPVVTVGWARDQQCPAEQLLEILVPLVDEVPQLGVGLGGPADPVDGAQLVEKHGDVPPAVAGQQEAAVARRQPHAEPLLGGGHRLLPGRRVAQPASPPLCVVEARQLFFGGHAHEVIAVAAQEITPLHRCHRSSPTIAQSSVVRQKPVRANASGCLMRAYRPLPDSPWRKAEHFVHSFLTDREIDVTGLNW